MSPDQFVRVKSLFSQLIQQSDISRSDLLARTCQEEAVVREEVERLLNLFPLTDNFLDKPLPQTLGLTAPEYSSLPEGFLVQNRYRIEKRLAQSGFATVYVATDQSVARKTVVLKIFDRIYLDQIRLTSFEAELAALAKLDHPNVVGVTDTGELADGTPFLVLDYVPGITLRELLRAGPLPITRTRTIVRALGNALGAAHRSGVFHLDVKPENIIIGETETHEDRVTIIDFGIAIVRDLPDRAVRAYSAPYAHPGGGAMTGAARDLYALALVACEMLLGKLPDSRNPIAKQLPEVMGRKCRNTITRVLGPDRPGNAPSLSEFISDFCQEERRSGGVWIPLVTGIALAAAGSVWISSYSLRPQIASRPVPLMTGPGSEYRPSFSRDGKWLFYTLGSPNHFEIYRKAVAGGEPVRLVSGQENNDWPQTSPDGTTLAYLKGYPNNEVAVVLKSLRSSGPDVEIVRAGFDSFAWAPDGKSLVVSQDLGEPYPRRLRVLDLAARTLRDLDSPPSHTGGDMRPAFSPDGKRLAFVRRWSQASADIFVGDIDSRLFFRGLPQPITHGSARIESVQWTPDGRELLYVAGPLMNGAIARISARGGASLPFLPGAERIESISIPQREWKLAYSRQLGDINVWRLNLQKAHIAAEAVITGTYDDEDAHLSPDGRHIAFHSTRSGHLQIWVSDADGSHQQQVTALEPAEGLNAVWAQNSLDLIISVHSKTLGQRIFRTSLLGLHDLKLILTDGLAVGVSRDGRWLYFKSRRQGDKWQLWRARLEDLTHMEQLTTGGAMFGIESIDGESLFFSKLLETDGLWEQKLPHGPPRRVVDSLYRRELFAPSPTGVYYVAGPPGTGKPVLWFKTFRDGRVIRLHTFERNLSWGLDLSADQHLLFSQQDADNSGIMLMESFR